MRVETQVTKMAKYSSNTVAIGNGGGVGGDKRISNHEASDRRRQTRFVNKKGNDAVFRRVQTLVQH